MLLDNRDVGISRPVGNAPLGLLADNRPTDDQQWGIGHAKLARHTQDLQRTDAPCGIGHALGGTAQGGNLRIAMPANQEPASLDGQVDPYQSTWLFNSFITDPLVILDPTGKYVPALATSWEASPDGKVWTFKLRDGVTFQDGTKFDAEAVKFNLERIADPKTASAQLKNDIGPFTKVEVLDPLTVRITYDTPWVTLLDALRRTPIWSPTAAQKFSVAEFQRNLVGTGPFKLTRMEAERPASCSRAGTDTAAGIRCRPRRDRSISIP